MTVDGSQPPVVVTDLDGTLLVEESSFPGVFRNLQTAIKEHGAELIVATSRSPQDVTELLPTSANGTLAICFDGGCVVKVTRESFSVLEEWNLDPAVVKTAVDRMWSVPCPEELFLFGSSIVGFVIAHIADESRQSFNVLTREIGVDRPLQRYKSPGEVASDFGFEGVRAVTWFDETEAVHEGKAKIDGSLPTETEVLTYPELRYDGYAWLDVVDESVNKGRALEAVLAETADPTTLIALGDSGNDVSMFKAADVALSPADADAIVREHATEVTPVRGGESFANYIAETLPTLLDQQ